KKRNEGELGILNRDDSSWRASISSLPVLAVLAGVTESQSAVLVEVGASPGAKPASKHSNSGSLSWIIFSRHEQKLSMSLLVDIWLDVHRRPSTDRLEDHFLAIPLIL